jgi:hypothetical protein
MALIDTRAAAAPAANSLTWDEGVDFALQQTRYHGAQSFLRRAGATVIEIMRADPDQHGPLGR